MGKARRVDWLLVIPYLLISLIGLLMIYSASSYRLMINDQSSLNLLKKQVIFIIGSWSMLFFIFRLKNEILLSGFFAKMLLCVGTVTLLLTRIGIFGVSINGAQRWVSILGFQFQPSEITNLAVILYLAYYLRKSDVSIEQLKKPLILVAICILLILFQPKVAGALLLFILAAVIFTTAKVPIKLTGLIFLVFLSSLLTIGALVMVLGSHGWLPHVFAHTYDRIRMIGNPFEDPYGRGFQMSNSYYALYNGGLLGLGLGNSITKKGFLPVAETDFIYSILVEELGLIVAIFVLGLLFFIILRLFRLGAAHKNQQAGLILLGVGTLLLLQTSINIASIVGLIPMTGVPLPFISYGGSSYLILTLGLGICMKFSSQELSERPQ